MRGDGLKWGIVAVVLLFFVAVTFSIVNATHVQEFQDCKVTGKDRTTSRDKDGNEKSDARIYTDSCGTFQVGDSLLSWTFSSADTFGSIEEGKTYDFKTRGFRVPFFSMFPNIVEVSQ